MPVPNAAGDGHHSVVKRVGFVAEGLGDAAQALGTVDGVLYLDAQPGVGAVAGPLGRGQGRVGAFFAASRLAVRQTGGRQVVVADQAQEAQISQQVEQVEQVEQVQIHIELVLSRR